MGSGLFKKVKVIIDKPSGKRLRRNEENIHGVRGKEKDLETPQKRTGFQKLLSTTIWQQVL